MSNLYVYADDYWGEDYIVLGGLLVPCESHLSCLSRLESLRCVKNRCWSYNNNDCAHNCRFHNLNNGHLHYNELGNASEAKLKILNRWYSYFTTEDTSMIFRILVIDLNKLDISMFGGNPVNVYNRFFRTLLSGAIGYHYYGKHATLAKVFHHQGPQADHPYFPRANLMRMTLESRGKFGLLDPEVKFVCGNHRDYIDAGNIEYAKHAQFIQLVDIALGGFCQLLTNTSQNKKHRRAAENMRYLFANMPLNKRHRVSVFPIYTMEQLKLQFPTENSLSSEFGLESLDFALSRPNFHNGPTAEMIANMMPRCNQSTLDLG